MGNILKLLVKSRHISKRKCNLSSSSISDQCTVKDHVRLPHFFFELELMAH